MIAAEGDGLSYKPRRLLDASYEKYVPIVNVFKTVMMT
jgi:hypothetical protein